MLFSSVKTVKGACLIHMMLYSDDSSKACTLLFLCVYVTELWTFGRLAVWRQNY